MLALYVRKLKVLIISIALYCRCYNLLVNETNASNEAKQNPPRLPPPPRPRGATQQGIFRDEHQQDPPSGIGARSILRRQAIKKFPALASNETRDEQRQMKTKNKLILSSTDYSKFNKDLGNRVVRNNPKLRASMEKYGWLDAFPMLVVLRDSRMVIKDGQHRFDTAQELCIPVKYVVMDEDGIAASEISVGLSWSVSDFVKSYAQRGNKEYQRLQSFKDETGLSLNVCATILAGYTGQSSVGQIVKGGQFKVRAEEQARKIVSVINAAKPIVRWAGHNYFVAAISQALVHAKIDPAVMCHKIRSHPGKLLLQPTMADFIEMIEALYNYRNQQPIAIRHLVKTSIKEIATKNAKAIHA